jgi:hypothetical protein
MAESELAYASVVEVLKRRFDFDAWVGSNTLGENLYIWKFFLSGNELPGWKAHRIQRVNVAAFPPAIQSIWRRSSEPADMRTVARPDPTPPDALLQLDAFECRSRMAAHELIVYLLGQFHLPGVERMSEESPGDVAFSTPASPIVVFARGNVVHMMRDVGRATLARQQAAVVSAAGARPALLALASRLDAALIEKPEPVGEPLAAAFRSLSAARLQRRLPAAARARVGETVPLLAEYPVAAEARGAAAAEAPPRRTWYKIFSKGGEVLCDPSDTSKSVADNDMQDRSDRGSGQLVYRPDVPGRQSIVVFAIDPELRRSTAEELTLEAD